MPRHATHGPGIGEGSEPRLGKDHRGGEVLRFHGSGSVTHNRRILLAICAVLSISGLIFMTWTIVPLEEYGIRTALSSEPDVLCSLPGLENTTAGLWVLLKFSVWNFGGKFSGLMTANLPDYIDYPDVEWSIIPEAEYELYASEGHFVSIINLHIGHSLSDHELESGTFYLILLKGYWAPDFPSSFEIAFYCKISGVHGAYLMPGIILVFSTVYIQVFYSYWKRRRRGLAPVDFPLIESES
jgi:hypothetical protein